MELSYGDYYYILGQGQYLVTGLDLENIYELVKRDNKPDIQYIFKHKLYGDKEHARYAYKVQFQYQKEYVTEGERYKFRKRGLFPGFEKISSNISQSPQNNFEEVNQLKSQVSNQ